jgi:hypothetical protein
MQGPAAGSSAKAMAFSDTAPSWDVLTEMVRWVGPQMHCSRSWPILVTGWCSQ